MEAVVGSFLSATVGIVVRKLGSSAIETVASSLGGVQNALGKLRASLVEANQLLADAERREPGEGPLKEWLLLLRKVAYDVDDMLDEIELKNLKDEAEYQISVAKHIPALKSAFRSMKYHSKIRDLQEKLDDILVRARRCGLERLTNQSQQAEFSMIEQRETSSITDDTVIGRDEEKEAMIRFLLSSPVQNERYSVISVVGMGGMGKTTLAQVVFNDDSILNHFDVKIWTCISDDVFSEKRITLQIIKQIASKFEDRSGSELCADDSWEMLQNRLRDQLTGKRFLLVLDDVWTEEHKPWEEFKKPFKFADDGSKILITTRSHKVSKIVSSMEKIELKGLSEEDLWSLFSMCAFGDSRISTKPSLEVIGRKIVGKLKDSPLAARTVGRLLHSDLSIEHWQNVQTSDMWELSPSAHDIMPSLRLSYQYLPQCLKPCFAFLSLFPKDHKILGEDLVRMWIAHDFVRAADLRGGSLEIIGMKYLNLLLDRCMIQNAWSFEDTAYERKYYYKMHDLIHDMARNISAEECFSIKQDSDIENVPCTVRHLSIFTDGLALDKVSQLQNLKQMHTILFFGNCYGEFRELGSHIHEIYLKAKKLRLLDASGYHLGELPSSIGELKHLRYLNLSHSGIRRLPTSLCALYNIRMINIKGFDLVSLPAGMKKLKNLRNLIVDGYSNPTTYGRGIGRLIMLQEQNFSILDKSGHRITELQNMTELRRLKIKGLENVRSKEEAMQARLVEKIHLKEMRLEWDSSYPRSSNKDEEVLEGLRPGKRIKRVEIINYKGVCLPSWMNDHDQMLSLRWLSIVGCPKLEKLLPWTPALPSLTVLELRDCAALLPLPLQPEGSLNLPPTMEELRVERCGDFPNSLTAEQFENLTSLRELDVGGCHVTTLFNILEAGSLNSLKKLLISGLQGVETPPRDALRLLQSLESLTFKDCQELVWLLRIDTLPSLHYLHIMNCPKLRLESSSSEPSSSSSLRAFRAAHMSPQQLKECLLFLQRAAPSLEQSFIKFCSELKTFDDDDLGTTLCNLSSLKLLDISVCSNLENLPAGLSQLTCLHFLEINSCPKIQSIPENGLPPSLACLRIKGCPMLEQRCQRHVGPDWSKISRIPDVFVNGEWISTDA